MTEAANAEILVALAKLDPKNDDHWTEQGAPLLDALGLAKKPTRAEVTSAAPLFSRTNPVLQEEAPVVEEVPEVVVDLAADEAALAELCDEVHRSQVVVDDAVKAVAIAQDLMHAAQRKHDEALVKLEKARPDNSNMLGIRAVLEAQQADRIGRSKIASDAREIGLTAALLDARSRLDASMGRNTARGGQRPQFNAR